MVTSPYEWKPLKWNENTQNKQTNKQTNNSLLLLNQRNLQTETFLKNTHFNISETLAELENKALEASSIFNKLLYLENYTKKTIFFKIRQVNILQFSINK